MHNSAITLSVGGTGTRLALTDWQQVMVSNLLAYHRALGFNEFHHGDCVGFDEYAASVAAILGYHVVSHPPTNGRLRAYAPSHEIRPPRPYLERNSKIVAESRVGIAAPDGETVRLRSGTWSTIQKMAEAQVPHWVITPTRCRVAAVDTQNPILGSPRALLGINPVSQMLVGMTRAKKATRTNDDQKDVPL